MRVAFKLEITKESLYLLRDVNSTDGQTREFFCEERITAEKKDWKKDEYQIWWRNE